MAASGLAYQAQGIVSGLKENPGRTAGELVGMGLVMHGAPKVGGAGARFVGEGTGLIRKSTYGFTRGEKIPYMSPGEEVQTIFDSKFISGARASARPAGQFIPTRQLRIRNPGSIGDIPAGEQVTAQGVFMTVSRPGLIEPHGTYFLSKSGGLTGLLGGKRVYLHENVRTVQIPETLKQSIYQSIQQRGEFWGPQYDAVIKLAKEQSRFYNEPIAIPSPKRAKGVMQPENEAFLVFEGKAATKITQTKFAGLTRQGAIVKRITLGEQPRIDATRLGSIAENIRYNWDVGRSGITLYNKNLVRAMVRDMERKNAELYGDALSYPGSYNKHGFGHAKGVYENLIRQYEHSPTLRGMTTREELWMRAKYHDIAKISDLETEPFRHGWVAGEAIEKGFFSTPELANLPAASRRAIAKDIRYHTDIRPGFLSGKGVATKLFYRPTATGKALATADRMDLGRFGAKVKQSRLFPVPEDTFRFTTRQIASDFMTGKRDLPIGFQVKFVDGPAPGRASPKPPSAYPSQGKTLPGVTMYSAATKRGTGYPTPSKGSDYSYPTQYDPAPAMGYNYSPQREYPAGYPTKYPTPSGYKGSYGKPPKYSDPVGYRYPKKGGYEGAYGNQYPTTYPTAYDTEYARAPYPAYPTLKKAQYPTTAEYRPPKTSRKYDADDRKIRAIRLDLSLKGFDWTVANPVPTWESVFGTTKTPNITITLPEFKL